MLLALLILVAVLVAAVLTVLVVVVLPYLGSLRRERVIVNLRSGPSLTGVLQRTWGGRLELSDGRLHEHGESHALDGRAVVWRTNVAFVQVLPPIDPDQEVTRDA